MRVIGKAFAGSGFEISFATSPENVLIAFCLGMVLTFAVVLISSRATVDELAGSPLPAQSFQLSSPPYSPPARVYPAEALRYE